MACHLSTFSESMPLVRERQFNLINFLYSLGTVILLVAALFMVLEWEYAKQLFAAGLFIEIVVFVISIIDKEPEELNYSEEIVFPPQAENIPKKEKTVSKKTEKLSELDDVKASLQDITDSISSLNNTTKDLVNTVSHIQDNYERLIERNSKNKTELELLKEKLDLTYKKLESINKA